MQIWHELLETAIHCPSPHNVQPWRVKILDERNAELYIDTRRTLPKEDVTGSFITLTMGIFVEALDILARGRKLRIEYELFHEPDWYAPAILASKIPEMLPFAKLSLTPCESNDPDFDKDIFLKRRTSRLHYDDRKIPDDVISTLTSLAVEWKQHFAVSTDPEQIGRIMNFNTAALFEDLNSRDYHDEIVEWFRYTNKHSQEHMDGLDARCMNTYPVNYWLISRCPWLMLFPGSKQIMSKVYRSQIGKIVTLGIISGPFWDPAAAIDAGRFLIRFWLLTAVHGLYIHPYGNLVTNHSAADSVKRELGIDNIWLVFKIGHSKEPPKSHRRPVEKVLL